MPKQHDWFATRLFQPDYTLGDFFVHGITPDNSDLKAKDDYRNVPEVIEAFTEHGQFNEKKFNEFYDTTLSLYNTYDNEEFEKRFIESYEHDPYEWYAPATSNFREVGARIVFGPNPLKESQGISGLLYHGPSEFSIREIAQNEKVHDENGNELDWTPNERGGLFKAITRPTLALAVWDEDGAHEVNGRLVTHKKGDMKFNQNGRPYYEELGDREMYGRDILHYTDTITIDGEGLNAIDVFDNDGITKSIGGTLMKTALQMGPLLIPGVGQVYGAIRAAMMTAQAVPTLMKAVNGMITNDNENTQLGQGLTKLENYMARFQSSVSDESRNKLITFENFGSLINQVGGQLFEQRMVGMIPKLFGKYGDTLEGAGLGRRLAQTYMAATSSINTYQDFKNAGATDRAAGVAMLATMGAFWKLMDQDYYKDVLFKGTFLDNSLYKKISWNVAKKMQESLKSKAVTLAKETGQDVIDAATKQEAKNIYQKVHNAVTKSIPKFFIDTSRKFKNWSDVGTAALSEGVEEVQEEAVSDLIKVLYKGAEALGLDATETDDNLNFGFSWSDAAARYGMSFFGGMVGGAMFRGFHNYEKMLNPKQLYFEDLDAIDQMTFMIAQNKEDELYKYTDQWEQRGRLGSTNLSGSDIKQLNLPGNENQWVAGVDSKYTQNHAVAEAVRNQIKFLSQILSNERFTNMGKTLTDVIAKDLPERQASAQLINILKINGGITRDFTRLGSKIAKTIAALEDETNKIKATKANDSAEEQTRIQEAINNSQKIKSLQTELSELRTLRDRIINGELNDTYVSKGLLLLDKSVSNNLNEFNKESFSQFTFGLNYGSLTPEQKNTVDELYNDFMAESGMYRQDVIFDIWSKANDILTPRIEEIKQKLQGVDVTKLYSPTLIIQEREKLAKEKDDLEAKRNELSNKTDKTKEENDELDALKIRINDLDVKIKQYDENPGLFLSQIGAEKTLMSDLQKAILELNNQTNVKQVADLIKNLYTSAKNNKQVLQNDAELNRFYEWIRASFLSTDITTRLSTYSDQKQQEFIDNNGYMDESDTAWMDLWIPKDSDGKYAYDASIFNAADNPIKTELVAKVEDFVQLFGKNNTEAVKKYNEIVKYLKDNTALDDTEIDNLLKELIPQVGDESIVDFIKDIDAIRQDITYSPFNELFQNFVTEMTGTRLPIIDVINAENLRLSEAQSVHDYQIINPFAKTELQNAELLINGVIAVLTGATDGLNQHVNKIKTKLGKNIWSELDEETGRYLLNEAVKLKNQITVLLKLDERNGANKLAIQNDIMVNVRPKFVHTMLSKPFAEAFKKATGIDVNYDWEQIQPDNFDWKNITKENYFQYEPFFIQFESGLYDKLSSLDTDQWKTLVKKLFSDEITKNHSGKFTKDVKEVIEPYDLLIHLTTLASVNSNDFFVKFRNIVKDPDFLYAPLFQQEYAIKTAYGMALNPDKFNATLQVMKEMSNDDRIRQKSTLYNMVLTLGGAGVGKTTVISRVVAELLNGSDTEFIYLAPSETQVNKLSNEIGIESKGKYTKLDFMKLITSSKEGLLPEHIIDNKKSFYFKSKDIYAIKTLELYSKDAKHKYLMIDEIGTFNSIELKLLSNWAQKNGVIIVGVGDQKQTSGKIWYKDGDGKLIGHPSGIEDTLNVHSPNLTSSLRAENAAKLENGNFLDVKLTDALDAFSKNPNWNPKDLSTYVSQNFNNTYKLKWFEGPNRIIGEIAVNTSDELINYVNKVKSFGGTIAIYVDSDKLGKYKSLETPPDSNGKRQITILPTENINGGEYDYVFIDKDWKQDATVNGEVSQFIALQDFYTATQRSRIATVFVNNGLIDEGGILPNILKGSSDPNVNVFPELDDKRIQQFKDWRLQGLNSLTPSASYDSNITPKSFQYWKDSIEDPFGTLNEDEEEKNPKEKKPENIKIPITVEKWANSEETTYIEEKTKYFTDKYTVDQLKDPDTWRDIYNIVKGFEVEFNDRYEGIDWTNQGKQAIIKVLSDLAFKYNQLEYINLNKKAIRNYITDEIKIIYGENLRYQDTWNNVDLDNLLTKVITKFKLNGESPIINAVNTQILQAINDLKTTINPVSGYTKTVEEWDKENKFVELLNSDDVIDRLDDIVSAALIEGIKNGSIQTTDDLQKLFPLTEIENIFKQTYPNQSWDFFGKPLAQQWWKDYSNEAFSPFYTSEEIFTEIQKFINSFTDNYFKTKSFDPNIDSVKNLLNDYVEKNLIDSDLWGSWIIDNFDGYNISSLEISKYLLKNDSARTILLKLFNDFKRKYIEHYKKDILRYFSDFVTAQTPDIIQNAFDKYKNSSLAQPWLDAEIKQALQNKYRSLTNPAPVNNISGFEYNKAYLKDWLTHTYSNDQLTSAEWWNQNEQFLDNSVKTSFISRYSEQDWLDFGQAAWNAVKQEYKKDNLPAQGLNNKSTKNIRETYLNTKNTINIANDEDYYNLLFSPDFLKFESSYSNSLLAFFDNNVEENSYRSVVRLIESVIKLNKNPKDFTTHLQRILQNDNKQRSTGYQKMYEFLGLLNKGTSKLVLKPYQDKAMMYYEISDDIRTLSIPIVIVNTNKFGEYKGNLEQNTSLMFDTRGSWKTIGELEREYPGINFSHSLGAISRDDSFSLNLSPDTESYLENNTGKGMTLASSNYLDDQNALKTYWAVGIGEGPGYKSSNEEFTNSDYTYKNHNRVKQFGITKPTSLFQVIKYATALTSINPRTRKTFDSGYLSSLGLIYQNGILQDTSIYDLIGGQNVINDIIPPTSSDKTEWRDFLRKLDNSKLQVLSNSQLGYFVYNIIGRTITDEQLKHAIIENLYSYFKNRNKQNYIRINAISSTGEEIDWMLKYVFDPSGKNDHYEIYEFVNGNIKNKVGESIPAIEGYNFDRVIQQITNGFSNIQLTLYNTSVDQHGTTYYNKETSNSTIALLFKNISNINNIDSLVADNSQYVYGIYTNVLASDFYPESAFYRKVVGELAEFTTDADTWYYPTYTIDESQIVESNPETDEWQIKLEEFNSKIQKIQQVLKDNHLNIQLSNIELKKNVDLDAYLNNIITKINDTLRKTTLTIKQPRIDYDTFDIIWENNKTQAFINNYRKKYGQDTGIIESQTIELPNATIYDTGKGYFFFGNDLMLEEIKTFNTWKALYDFAQNNPSIFNYVTNLYGEITNELENSVELLPEDIKNQFNDLLIKHLEDKLANDEC